MRKRTLLNLALLTAFQALLISSFHPLLVDQQASSHFWPVMGIIGSFIGIAAIFSKRMNHLVRWLTIAFAFTQILAFVDPNLSIASYQSAKSFHLVLSGIVSLNMSIPMILLLPVLSFFLAVTLYAVRDQQITI